jgi:hypothetical protein
MIAIWIRYGCVYVQQLERSYVQKRTLDKLGSVSKEGCPELEPNTTHKPWQLVFNLRALVILFLLKFHLTADSDR